MEISIAFFTRGIMREENEAIYHRWIEEVWNKGNDDAIEELFDENGVAEYQYLGKDNLIRGIDGYKKFARWKRELCTNIHITIEQIATSGNKVIAVCVLTANCRNGDLEDLEKPKTIQVSGLCQATFENGKIIRIWNNINLFGDDDSNMKSISKPA
jgi:predicted ester cyclase